MVSAEASPQPAEGKSDAKVPMQQASHQHPTVISA